MRPSQFKVFEQEGSSVLFHLPKEDDGLPMMELVAAQAHTMTWA
jgi:hypothetical protein